MRNILWCLGLLVMVLFGYMETVLIECNADTSEYLICVDCSLYGRCFDYQNGTYELLEAGYCDANEICEGSSTTSAPCYGPTDNIETNCTFSSTGSSPSTGSTTDMSTDIPCPACGYIEDSDTSSCNGYLSCENGTSIHGSCPGLTCFDGTLCECVL